MKWNNYSADGLLLERFLLALATDVPHAPTALHRALAAVSYTPPENDSRQTNQSINQSFAQSMNNDYLARN